MPSAVQMVPTAAPLRPPPLRCRQAHPGPRLWGLEAVWEMLSRCGNAGWASLPLGMSVSAEGAGPPTPQAGSSFPLQAGRPLGSFARTQAGVRAPGHPTNTPLTQGLGPSRHRPLTWGSRAEGTCSWVGDGGGGGRKQSTAEPPSLVPCLSQGVWTCSGQALQQHPRRPKHRAPCLVPEGETVGLDPPGLLGAGRSPVPESQEGLNPLQGKGRERGEAPEKPPEVTAQDPWVPRLEDAGPRAQQVPDWRSRHGAPTGSPGAGWGWGRGLDPTHRKGGQGQAAPGRSGPGLRLCQHLNSLSPPGPC